MPTMTVRAVEDREVTEGPCFAAAAEEPEVHVWRASLCQPPEGAAHLRRALSSDERARCARLRSSRDRRRYALGRGVLRLVLARYTGEAPHELAFSYGRAGKPSLSERGARTIGPRLHFNLSHSEDLLLIAVSRRAPVGIDVERVRPIWHMEQIARRWLSIDEYRAIRRAPTATRKTELFFAAWTSAEARAKATGEGLWGARGKDGHTHADLGSPALFRPEPGFVAAVALGASSTATAACAGRWRETDA